MVIADKRRLHELACRLLEATRDDDEQWSFLFRTPGAIDLLYCPWSSVEDLEFNGNVSELRNLLSADRICEIEVGDDALSDDELALWRLCKCRELAKGSDWSLPAWIVPIWENDGISGWALALDRDLEPYVSDVFESEQAARDALDRLGAVR